MNWLKTHPYATGAIVIVGGILLYLTLRGSSSSGSSSGSPLPLAQLNAATSIQEAQLSAQSNAATQQAQVQQQEIAASAAQSEQQSIGAIVGNAIAGQQQLQGVGLQTQLQSQQLGYELNLAQNNMALEAQQGTNNYNLALNALNNTNEPTGVNELALLYGQGGIGSYNQEQATYEQTKYGFWSSLVSGLLGGIP